MLYTPPKFDTGVEPWLGLKLGSIAIGFEKIGLARCLRSLMTQTVTN